MNWKRCFAVRAQCEVAADLYAETSLRSTHRASALHAKINDALKAVSGKRSGVTGEIRSVSCVGKGVVTPHLLVCGGGKSKIEGRPCTHRSAHSPGGKGLSVTDSTVAFWSTPSTPT
jgi:hypothetical protein